MNREEAKYLLRAYRMSGKDAGSPLFQEAVELARQDPELAEWFSKEQRVDEEIAKKLRVFPAGPELKHQLLALRRIIRPTPWWQSRTAVLSAAAAVVFLGVMSFWLVRLGYSNLEQFRGVTVQAALNRSQHVDFEGPDRPNLRRWIREHGGVVDLDLPRGMAAAPVAGCKVIDWHEQKVTLLCLMPGRKHYDIFVIEKAGLWREFVKATPQFQSRDGLNTAVWRRGDRVYLLTGSSPRSEMEKLL